MIIFGWWRRITRNIWPTQRIKCSHCGNENFFYLKVVTTWFTLFFIPIFPYERYHFLYCPTCEYWIKIDSEQVHTLKPIAKLNQRLVDWEITQEEYSQWLKDLSWERKEIIEEIESIEDIQEIKQCPYCWWEIKAVAKKCRHCKKWLE
jgi:predicted nucleic-acid-binding Zn-ribbon protein